MLLTLLNLSFPRLAGGGRLGEGARPCPAPPTPMALTDAEARALVIEACQELQEREVEMLSALYRGSYDLHTTNKEFPWDKYPWKGRDVLNSTRKKKGDDGKSEGVYRQKERQRQYRIIIQPQETGRDEENLVQVVLVLSLPRAYPLVPIHVSVENVAPVTGDGGVVMAETGGNASGGAAVTVNASSSGDDGEEDNELHGGRGLRNDKLRELSHMVHRAAKESAEEVAMEYLEWFADERERTEDSMPDSLEGVIFELCGEVKDGITEVNDARLRERMRAEDKRTLDVIAAEREERERKEQEARMLARRQTLERENAEAVRRKMEMGKTAALARQLMPEEHSSMALGMVTSAMHSLQLGQETEGTHDRDDQPGSATGAVEASPWGKKKFKSRYLNDYTELEALGRGGFGEVVKARYNLDQHVYAIKKVRLAPVPALEEEEEGKGERGEEEKEGDDRALKAIPRDNKLGGTVVAGSDSDSESNKDSSTESALSTESDGSGSSSSSSSSSDESSEEDDEEEPESPKKTSQDGDNKGLRKRIMGARGNNAKSKNHNERKIKTRKKRSKSKRGTDDVGESIRTVCFDITPVRKAMGDKEKRRLRLEERRKTALENNDRVRREVNLLSALSHPGIVRYYTSWIEYDTEVVVPVLNDLEYSTSASSFTRKDGSLPSSSLSSSRRSTATSHSLSRSISRLLLGGGRGLADVVGRGLPLLPGELNAHLGFGFERQWGEDDNGANIKNKKKKKIKEDPRTTKQEVKEGKARGTRKMEWTAENKPVLLIQMEYCAGQTLRELISSERLLRQVR